MSFKVADTTVKATLNAKTNKYEAEITAPSTGGEYNVTVIAEDTNGAVNTVRASELTVLKSHDVITYDVALLYGNYNTSGNGSAYETTSIIRKYDSSDNYSGGLSPALNTNNSWENNTYFQYDISGLKGEIANIDKIYFVTATGKAESLYYKWCDNSKSITKNTESDFPAVDTAAVEYYDIRTKVPTDDNVTGGTGLQIINPNGEITKKTLTVYSDAVSPYTTDIYRYSTAAAATKDESLFGCDPYYTKDVTAIEVAVDATAYILNELKDGSNRVIVQGSCINNSRSNVSKIPWLYVQYKEDPVGVNYEVVKDGIKVSSAEELKAEATFAVDVVSKDIADNSKLIFAAIDNTTGKLVKIKLADFANSFARAKFGEKINGSNLNFKAFIWNMNGAVPLKSVADTTDMIK